MNTDTNLRPALGRERGILIVDPHPLSCRGLRNLIAEQAGLTVCGEVGEAGAALRAVEKVGPDLVILELVVDLGFGLGIIRDIKKGHEAVPVLVLSASAESVYAERTIKAGARGYVSKLESETVVLQAIRDVLDGGTFLSDTMAIRLAKKYLCVRTQEADGKFDMLSDRELEVFELIGHGHSTRDIAERLFLSIKTIESHREHIKKKLVILNGTELVQSATRWIDSARKNWIREASLDQ